MPVLSVIAPSASRFAATVEAEGVSEVEVTGGPDGATGDYVWLAEPGDEVAPGSLAALVHQLRTQRPDVLALTFLRRAPNGLEKVMRAAPSARRFDKVLRRELLEGAADTGAAMAAAERVLAYPPAAFVHHREPGGALRPPAKSRRGVVAKRRRRFLKRIERSERERRYAARRRQPLDPDLAVFAAYWYRGYACNPAAIYEKACALVPGFRGVWVVNAEGAAAMPGGVEHVTAGSREYFDLIARAKYFVNNVNFPNHLVKREGTVHVMTHHGTPLKRMGLDLRDTQVAGKRMDFDALLRRCARWDYSVSANPLSTETWARVYPTGHESIDAGYPRNDALANATAEDVARVRAELGIEAGRRAVLYAPTHREYRDSFVAPLDLATLADALGDDHVVLARMHYFYDADPHVRDLHAQGRLLDVAAHPSIEALCLAADALVTDYSSLMFDYAVLDRPIVVHAPDWDVYRTMRGTYFDLLAEPPGAVARTEFEVADAIRAGDPAPQDRAAFRARYCPWDDGGAAERVVRRVWGAAG